MAKNTITLEDTLDGVMITAHQNGESLINTRAARSAAFKSK